MLPHRSRGLTERSDEYENVKNQKPWPPQSVDLNSGEHLQIWDPHDKPHSQPSSSKPQMREYLFEEIPLLEFQRLVESMPRTSEAVLVARGGPY